MELEMLFDHMMFTDVKKRYAGRKVWTDKRGWLSDDVPFIERQKIMGFEFRRGDSAPITKESQALFMNMIFNGASKEEIIKHFSQVAEDVRTGNVERSKVYRKTKLKREFEDYVSLAGGNKGAKWFNETLASDTIDPIVRGEQFFFTHAKDGPTHIVEGGYIAFTDEDQIADFELDWRLIAKKTIEGPMSALFKPLGWKLDKLRGKKTYVISDFAV
jgi:DNA polymerase I